jgi:hypothetical protein
MFRVVVRQVRRQPVAFVALFFALGGGAMAASPFLRATHTIRSGDLAGSTYGSPVIARLKVDSGKLANGAVTTSKFDPSAVAPNSSELGGRAASAFMQNGAAAGGDLTGNYPAPTIAPGKVTTQDFAPGAQAPDASELGGVRASSYLQGQAYAITHVRPGSQAEFSSVSDVGVVNLSCSDLAVPSFTYTNHGSDRQDVGINSPGGTATSLNIPPGATTGPVTVTQFNAPVTVIVSSHSGPSAQWDIMSVNDSADCSWWGNSVLFPNTQ